MNKLFKVGLVAALMAATISSEPVLAKKVTAVRKQHPIFYRSDDIRCVERSFSISVGNPANKSRVFNWPAPCGH